MFSRHELPSLKCSEEDCLADFVLRKDARLNNPGACSLEFQSVMQILTAHMLKWDLQTKINRKRNTLYSVGICRCWRRIRPKNTSLTLANLGWENQSNIKKGSVWQWQYNKEKSLTNLWTTHWQCCKYKSWTPIWHHTQMHCWNLSRNIENWYSWKFFQRERTWLFTSSKAQIMGPRGASNRYIFNRHPTEHCCGQIWHGVVKQDDTYSYVISTGARKLELPTL